MEPTTKQEAKYKTKNLMSYISDKTAVGMAKIRNEDFSDVEVAVVKATLNDEVLPKEKHVRTLKITCAAGAPRQQVNFVIHMLAKKRLDDKAGGWLVTLKTLIVFHRLMRDTDPSFQEELLRYSERTGLHRLLRLDSFVDHTTKETWDYSAWVRVYSVYLDERLATFRVMRFDPEVEASQENRDSKLKSCSGPELLEYLPAVQRLLSRLVACVPEGAAQRNAIVLHACSLVLKEVRSTYKAVSEGIMNMADKFFEMERNDALTALELYKENVALNDKLKRILLSHQQHPAAEGPRAVPHAAVAAGRLPDDAGGLCEGDAQGAGGQHLDAQGGRRASHRQGQHLCAARGDHVVGHCRALRRPYADHRTCHGRQPRCVPNGQRRSRRPPSGGPAGL